MLKKEEMTYWQVILFAMITAAYTAAVNIIPVTHGTSFADISVTIEWWILFAMIIIIRCNSARNASIKTFLFFLISQPLVYLIEAPFSSEGLGLFRFYPYWAVWTVLTIPGAFIAWQVKRKNILSAVILAVATSVLALQGYDYFLTFLKNPPYHILTVIFCVGQIFYLAFTLFDKKYLSLLTISITLAVLLFFIRFSVNRPVSAYIMPEGHQYEYVNENEDLVKVQIRDEIVSFTPLNPGTAYVTITDENGTQYRLRLEIAEKTYNIEIFDFDDFE